MDFNLINDILGTDLMSDPITITDVSSQSDMQGGVPPSTVIANTPINSDGLVKAPSSTVQTDSTVVKEADVNQSNVKSEESTKDDSKSNTGVEEDPSVAYTIGAATGYQILDSEGSPISFADNVDGLIERERMLVDLVRQQAITEVRQDLLNNPMFVQSLAEQSTSQSYTGLSFDALTEDQKVVILQNSLIQKGLDANFITYTVNRAVEDKRLNELAGPALIELQKIEQQYVTQVATEQLEQQQAHEELMVRAQTELITLLNKGEVFSEGQTIKVPSIIKTIVDGKEKMLTRQDVYNYVTAQTVKMDDDSMITQYQYDVITKNQQKTVDDVIVDAIQLLTKQKITNAEMDSDLKSRYDKLRNKIVTPKETQAKGRMDNSNLSNLIKQNLTN